MQGHRAFSVVILVALATGCTSPEAKRARGGGPGADPGNRGAVVKTHEGSEPYYGTPRITPGGDTRLQPASHARAAEAATRP